MKNDVTFVLILLAFFALSALFVVACDRIIGPDEAGNLLELVGGDLGNGDRLIWHAMRCRRAYLEKYAA